MNADQFESFIQFKYNHEKWSAFMSAKYGATYFQRTGLFKNDRYSDSSLGEGEEIGFKTYGVKSGFTYKLTERHWLSAHGSFMKRPPVLQNVFINPRENNSVVPNIQSETNSTVDLNYFLRLPKLTGRLTGFYTRFQNHGCEFLFCRCWCWLRLCPRGAYRIR
ncbi:hypothetical protein [Zobellia laminariae]|uniref:hypothetical protein n=1 Tax=Zobellia laminariae TaxID=248906 RepID=UPI0026F43B58|nr:hypothetical protein [Zobellia laminariae]WKX77742.1 hypothetical protein Q5W13_07020 [Zobellia laminariae]